MTGEEFMVPLAGRAAGVTFSPTGRFVAVAGYDGRVQLVEADTGRIVFKHAVKGSKRDLPIHHHAFREDERLYAFSCLRRVFVVDIPHARLVAEVDVDEGERLLSVPFVLDPCSDSILLGRAPHVVRRPFDGGADEVLFTSPHSGLAEDIAVDASGRFIAFKRGTGPDGAFVMLHERATATTRALPVPYEYVPGRAMSEVRLRFTTDARTLLVLSKTGGCLRFDVRSAQREERISWEELGFRTLHGFRASRFAEDGRYLLVNAERSTSPELATWSVPIPEGLRWVLYDLAARETVLVEANGEGSADVHALSSRWAFIRLRATHGLAKDHLVIRRFA
jgi:hypothetical protein